MVDKLLLAADPNFTPAGITTTVGQLYEKAPGGLSRAHIFFGPTRIATLEREEVITARLVPGTSGTRYRFLAEGLRFTRRALAKIEETFVGKAYAEVPLPPGVTTRFYHGDHLGSINVVTDHTGAQVEMKEYHPYGQESFRAPEGGEKSPFGFTGKRLDSSTGLYYYGARYYDPELGRFTQPDSIVQAPSDPQTLNRYTYVRNNPLIYTDPTGHSFWKSVKKFFKAAAGILIGAVVTIATGGFGAPLALALGGFAAGFSGTMINGGSPMQALGMGLVGAFAGGVGGLAWGLQGAARIAALTAIGATAGAAGSAIMGGNIGLGAAAGAAAGFLGGAAGGRLSDSWNPGIARTVAGFATAAGGGAISAAIAGGNAALGAGLGLTAAIAAVSLQKAIDLARARGGQEAVSAITNMQRRWQIGERPEGNLELTYRLMKSSLEVDQSSNLRIGEFTTHWDTSGYRQAAKEFIEVNDKISTLLAPGVKLPFPINYWNLIRKGITEWVRWSTERSQDQE